MKSNHEDLEDHEELREKIKIITLWFLRDLRALRGEPIFLLQNAQSCFQRGLAFNSNPK